MSSANDAQRSPAPMSAEDSFLDLLIETVDGLDRAVRAPFLQKFIKAMTQVELTEPLSLDYWEQILQRRKELSESLNKTVSLKTAMVDVLTATNFLRMPILMEYEELKKLQINAATDALTGLYNRRLFDEYFSKELNRAKRYGQHIALVLMDLHKFKEVNDRFGHLQGDQALQIAASTLRRTLRTSDYAFRIGGDEFALLLLQAEPEQVAALCKRLRSTYEAGIAPMKIEVSLALDYGMAVYPEDGEEREGLIKTADDRLYALKNATRTQPRLESVPREVPPAPVPAAPLESPLAAAAAAGAARTRSGADKRKWERVSMAGTRAYATLGENAGRTARVVDLSYGGVALQMDTPEEAPASFSATLHVPILPPVKVSLRRTYLERLPDNRVRIGCAFVS